MKTGVGSLQDGQVIEGKDLRPCHTEYPLPTVSAATLTSCSLRDKSLPEVLEDVARLGAQLLVQAALEAEVTEFLGRDRYQRPRRARMPGPGHATGTGR